MSDYFMSANSGGRANKTIKAIKLEKQNTEEGREKSHVKQ